MKGKQVMSTVLIIIAVLVLAFSGRIVYENNQAPKLGVSEGKFKPLSSKPNNVSTQAQDPAKQVKPLSFKSDATSTMTAIKASIDSYGGAKVIEETGDYLYVIFTTEKMKFNDDVEFWLDATNQEVHFRSASRAGYSDLGLNRKRYNELANIYGSIN